MDLISSKLEGLPPGAYAKRVAAVRSKERRYCEHPECQARDVDPRGKGTRLAWDNEGPLCGPCHRNVMRKTPEKPKQEQHHIEVSYAPRSQHSYLYGLESIMKDKGVSNLHLAREAKMHKDTISSYRITRTRCHPDRAAIIAKALGVSVEELKSE